MSYWTRTFIFVCVVASFIVWLVGSWEWQILSWVGIGIGLHLLLDWMERRFGG